MSWMARIIFIEIRTESMKEAEMWFELWDQHWQNGLTCQCRHGENEKLRELYNFISHTFLSGCPPLPYGVTLFWKITERCSKEAFIHQHVDAQVNLILRFQTGFLFTSVQLSHCVEKWQTTLVHSSGDNMFYLTGTNNTRNPGVTRNTKCKPVRL